MGYALQKNLLQRRYGNVCFLCKRELAVKEMQAHHLIPRSAGGTDDFFNLSIVCAECHRAIHKHPFGSEEYSQTMKKIEHFMM